MGLLGRWDAARNAPIYALLVQALIAVVLIVVGVVSERSSIQTLVDYTAPVFWLFPMLIGISVFVFRRRAVEPPAFRVPLYPILPILFILVSALMMYSSLRTFGLGSLLGLAILASGAPVLLAGQWWIAKKQRAPRLPRPDR